MEVLNTEVIISENLMSLKNRVVTFLLQKKRSDATEAVTNYILANNHIKTIRNDDKQEIWIYKSGIYIPNGKSYIEELCREIFVEGYTSFLKNDVIYKIMAETYIVQEEFFLKQNDYVNIVPVMNGLLNIYTRELEPFTPTIYFFNKLPVYYDPKADCPNLKTFFSEILSSEVDVLSVQELFGYSMLKEYKYEKAFMFLGNGRNGKGKLLEVLKRFLGVDNCANLSLVRIEHDVFSLCELQNKLVNISPDISKAGLENTGEFKSLTGRDMIHANRKFKTMVKFENYAKMIFAANELPRTSDMTEAFFQRWEIINFPYTFYNELDYEKNKHNKFAKLRNANIISEITSQDEMNGLLNWSLDGFDRLSQNKLFSCTKTSDVVRDFWIRKSDSALSFVNEMLVDDVDGFISWSGLKNIYKNFCSQNDLLMLQDKYFRRVILDNTLAYSSRKWLDKDQVRGFSGISYRDVNSKKQTRF